METWCLWLFFVHFHVESVPGISDFPSINFNQLPGAPIGSSGTACTFFFFSPVGPSRTCHPGASPKNTNPYHHPAPQSPPPPLRWHTSLPRSEPATSGLNCGYSGFPGFFCASLPMPQVFFNLGPRATAKIIKISPIPCRGFGLPMTSWYIWYWYLHHRMLI